MFNFHQRSKLPEILDDFALSGNDLSENLRELEQVNRLLGGYRIVTDGLKQLLQQKGPLPKELLIVDIGCGAGDALRVLSRWAAQKPCQLQLVGIDANAAAVDYARKAAIDYPNITVKQLDVLSADFEELKADVVMFNLFLHHFEEEQIVRFLRHCRAAGAALLINDLQRSKLAYHAFRLLSRILNFSYISRHDGKLSVKKSFTRHDWHRILKKAGIEDYQIKWRWAFRYQILVS